jgi:hypothetical protein
VALTAGGTEEQRNRGVPEEEDGGSEGSLWNFQKTQGPFCKVKFPTKQKLKVLDPGPRDWVHNVV